MSTSAEKVPVPVRRPSSRILPGHVSRRFVLTVGAAGEHPREVERYRTKAEAIAAFAPWEAQGLVGRVHSVSGPQIALALPIDPNAPSRPQSTQKQGPRPPRGPITAPHVRQDKPGASIMVTAWGETKNLHEWTGDRRAKANYGTIRERLSRKRPWSPERAISTPPADSAVKAYNRENAPKHVAFGESKTVNEWARDPRCATSPFLLRKRLKHGVPIELALRGDTPSPWRKIGRRHEALGEAKSLVEWAQDPRCRMSYEVLASRVRSGMSVADAISRQGSHAVKAFGEAKTLNQWARDPRCVVTGQTLRNRLGAGVPLEKALTESGMMTKPRLQEAFGETKTLAEWLHDPRRTATLQTVSQRLRAGVPLEEALVAAPRDPHGRAAEHEAFGERKTLSRWLGDPRCQAAYDTVRSRLNAGVPFETAIGKAVPARATHERGAFGETRTLDEWARDARCAVPRPTLFARLRSGMPLESALTQPLPSDGSAPPERAD